MSGRLPQYVGIFQVTSFVQVADVSSPYSTCALCVPSCATHCQLCCDLMSLYWWFFTLSFCFSLKMSTHRDVLETLATCTI